MTKTENLLEKALNKFERTNSKNIVVKRNSYPNPHEYSRRVLGVRLVLTHNIDQTYTDNAAERESAERYNLKITSLNEKETIIEFQERCPNFGRIKLVYELVNKKVNKYNKEKDDKDKRIEENTKERIIKRLNRRL
jgi:hypothetical protein